MTTPSQTVGPYLSIGLPWPDGPDVVAEGTPGAFLLHGVVTDGAGDPVPDALVETWQADPAGRFDHPDDPRGAVSGFRGFGRCPTDDSGRYAIRTLRPGPVPGQLRAEPRPGLHQQPVVVDRAGGGPAGPAPPVDQPGVHRLQVTEFPCADKHARFE